MLAADPDLEEEFSKIFNKMDIPEADTFTPEAFKDNYLDMELSLPRESEGHTFARVKKRLRDKDGLPLGTSNDNPLLDSRLYEVEYLDGKIDSLTANQISENLFSQVDPEGNRYVLFESICDHRTDGKQILKENGFIKSNSGGRTRKKTTRGWELLVQWKDGSTTWETLKDMKNSYPLEVTDYAIIKNLTDEPAFAWWIPYVLKKRNRIIKKVKSKYWTRTHKFGIEIPKSVAQAKRIDEKNGNSLWWDAIQQEMKNVSIAFDRFDGTESDIPKGYQYINCHMIFDVKMGEKS